MIIKPEPKLDLVLERVVDVPRHLLWGGWTTPQYLKQWFTPAPWPTVDCPSTESYPFFMTAAIMLESVGNDADARQKHEQMGFHVGWGKALDQLVALARTL